MRARMVAAARADPENRIIAGARPVTTHALVCLPGSFFTERRG